MLEEVVTLNGVDYLVKDLTDQAKALVESLKFVDQEVANTQARLAVLNTAKTSYMAALQAELPIVNN